MVVAVTDAKRGDPSTDVTSQTGKDEINLAMLPMAVASTSQPRRADGTKEHKHVITTKRWDDQIQTWVPARITFKTNTDDGLVTTVDEQYLVAFLHFLYEESQFTDYDVRITPHRLFRVMQLDGRGRDYDRLELALLRWTAATIVYEDAWWDKNKEEYRDVVTLSIISESRYRRAKNNSKRSGNNELFIRFNKGFIDLLNSGVVKNLNLEEYYSFKPLAARLYRVLDRHFHDNSVYEVDLRVFACGMCGLADTHTNGALKRKLAPAIKELEEAGYIKPVPTKERYRKIKAGIWRIRFERATNAAGQSVLQELLDRGVSKGVAHSLVSEHATDYIREKVDLLDWKMRNKHDGVSDNPAGFLVKSIRDDYQPPKDSKTREQLAAEEETKRKRAAAQQRQRASDQTESSKLRDEHAELRDKYEAEWLALSADDRAAYDRTVAKKMGSQSEKALAYWHSLFRRNPSLMLYERLQVFAEAKQDQPAA